MGQGEGVGMPLKDRKAVGKPAQHRVVLAFCGQLHLGPAKFRRGADVVGAAKGAGGELRAKADAKRRAVGGGEAGDQFCQLGQIGVGVIGQRILLAAKDDQGVMVGGVLRQGLAEMGFEKVDPRAGFVQRDADLAVVGDAGIFDDGDAHERLRC